MTATGKCQPPKPGCQWIPVFECALLYLQYCPPNMVCLSMLLLSFRGEEGQAGLDLRFFGAFWSLVLAGGFAAGMCWSQDAMLVRD